MIRWAAHVWRETKRLKAEAARINAETAALVACTDRLRRRNDQEEAMLQLLRTRLSEHFSN